MATDEGYPTVAEVRAWIGAAPSSISDADLQSVLDAEGTSQAHVCRIPAEGLPKDLYAALLRRCAREVAARGVPLGLASGADEYGTVRLSSWDAEIERLEGPRRILAFG